MERHSWSVIEDSSKAKEGCARLITYDHHNIFIVQATAITYMPVLYCSTCYLAMPSKEPRQAFFGNANEALDWCL
jgi:hypothetical protein